ncbi:peptidase [uncultured Salinisphaera sp.]|uniref:PepSY domain-containing protein n=1 Tax=Salinisphaera sp. C84B14 TaxID=1304155 RepID=UPI0032B1B3BB
MSRSLISCLPWLCLGCLLIGGSAALHADDVDAEGARRARDAGKIAPLRSLFDKVERECRGRFVEMELEEDDGRWTYEIKLIGPGGDVAELEYDAADLRLLEAEGKGLDALECVPPGTPD